MKRAEVIHYLLGETSTHLRHLEEQRSQFCSVIIAVVAGILAFGANAASAHLNLCGYAILILGLFGALLSWRQNEKINYYKLLYDGYLRQLLSAPESEASDLLGYHLSIRKQNARSYLWINHLPTGLFWFLIYLAVVFLGVRLIPGA